MDGVSRTGAGRGVARSAGATVRGGTPDRAVSVTLLCRGGSPSRKGATASTVDPTALPAAARRRQCRSRRRRPIRHHRECLAHAAHRADRRRRARHQRYPGQPGPGPRLRADPALRRGPRSSTPSASTRPTSILLDLMLPDIDGFAICDQLKRNRETNLIPVIMVTALNDAEPPRRGRPRRGQRLPDQAVHPRPALRGHRRGPGLARRAREPRHHRRDQLRRPQRDRPTSSRPTTCSPTCSPTPR